MLIKTDFSFFLGKSGQYFIRIKPLLLEKKLLFEILVNQKLKFTNFCANQPQYIPHEHELIASVVMFGPAPGVVRAANTIV